MNTVAEVLGVCEGITDEAVLRRLFRWARRHPSHFHVTSGKAKLVRGMHAFVNVSRRQPCFVLLDLDREECPPQALHDLDVEPSAGLCIRFAVRAVESWLMADRVGMSAFLGITANRLPVAPDLEQDPVRTLIAAARHSKRRWVGEDLLARSGSGRKRGPGYAGRMIEFVEYHWDIEAARGRSPSLDRALACLATLP